MELTIEEALQQGITAHKEGKVQAAELLYRAIIQSQPTHPDANHNLGILEVSLNKAELALPLFETALEANPKIEQFWLSYIDALIKEKQFETAKQIIQQAKTHGVAEEKLNVLETQLTPTVQVNKPKLAVKNKSLSLSQKRKKLSEQKKQRKAKKQNLKANNPSQQQISSLLEYYQNGRFAEAEKLAVSITQEFPTHQFGWKVLGAVLAQTGRKSEAVDANQKAVALSPQDTDAHSNLGNTLKELGRLDEAEASYKQAIALKPDYAEAHSNLGNTLKELGKLDEAEASYKQAIALKPDFAEAYSNLGGMLQELGRLDEAEASCTQAIALTPGFAEDHYNLGNTLQQLDRLDEAKASYTQAIALKPDYATAHNNLGTILQELGRLDEAEASFRQAIALKPDYARAHYNLGITLKELGRLNEAEASYKQAIALKPDYAEAHNNLGATLQELDRLDEAEASLRQAIALKPDSAEAHNNLGGTLQELDRLDEAEASLRQAIALKPDSAEAHNNLGGTLQELGRLDEAIASYTQAIALKPDYVEAKTNLSYLMLKKGELKKGFELMEHRTHDKNLYITPPPIDVPTYQGQHLLDRHLLIYGEQGIGDEVMFASILNDLNNQGAVITLVCNARLVDLFNRSFEFLTAMSSYKSSETPADYWVLIGSLAKFYRNDISKFENNLPSYLNADDDLIKKWKKRFNELESPLNIGISWRGGSKAYIKKKRSLNLEQLTPILSIATKSANIINLQYGEHKDEIEAFEKRTNIIIHDWQDADPLKDLDNLSAQIKALDLVISVDGATVHFAGSLGVKTFVMLPFVSDWRWALERDNSYWHPKTIQLFRQQNRGDWIPVIKKIADHLARILNTVATTDE